MEGEEVLGEWRCVKDETKKGKQGKCSAEKVVWSEGASGGRHMRGEVQTRRCGCVSGRERPAVRADICSRD